MESPPKPNARWVAPCCGILAVVIVLDVLVVLAVIGLFHAFGVHI